MKENTSIVNLKIVIKRKKEDVFKYTLDSNNTPKYFTSMLKEVASDIPAKLGTILKNTSDEINWDSYEIIDYEENTSFTLSSKESTYHVKYNFSSVPEGTLFEYCEWVEEGTISNPTSIETLELLKHNLEKDNN